MKAADRMGAIRTHASLSKRRLGWQTQQKPECWVTTQPTSANPTACYKP